MIGRFKDIVEDALIITSDGVIKDGALLLFILPV